MRAELIFRRGAPPDAEYTFKHALVQDAAYSTLLRSRRQQLHGHITAILEAHFPEIVQTQPDVLARHSAEAALAEKAVGYWLKAGQQAMARWAMTEAAGADPERIGVPFWRFRTRSCARSRNSNYRSCWDKCWSRQKDTAPTNPPKRMLAPVSFLRS